MSSLIRPIKNLASLLLGLLFMVGMLSGCSSILSPPATPGTTGPALKKPLPQTQHLLVLSVLRNVKIDIIRENIFIYQNLGTITTSASLVNERLSQTLQATLKQMDYSQVDTAVINTDNVLNTTDIQALSNHAFIELTPEAKQFLAQQIKNSPVDTIVLITQNGDQPLAFDLKCEVGKDNRYYEASFEPHLYLYKIYLINAHTLKILTWITGSPSGNLPDTHLCRPVDQLSGKDRGEIRYRIMDGLNTSVSADLSKMFGG